MRAAVANKNLNNLGTEKISKLVFSFFATTFAGLILNSVYNLTDTLFVSWGVGDIAMGGVSIVFPLVLLQGGISTTIGGGAASLIARKLGEGRLQDAGKITANAMMIFYTISILVSIFGLIFMTPLLKLMGATDELLPHAKEYCAIILIGNVFSTGFSSIVRAEGKMLYAMMMWVVPISVNIVLDAIFILWFGWGVRGSAFATVLSQFTSFIMCVIFFAKKSSQQFKGVRPDFKTIKDIIKIGLPSLVQTAALSVIIALLNIMLSKTSGATGIVAFGYISKLVSYAIAPFIAITQAIAPIVGYNYGIKNMDRVKETTSFCVKISVILAVTIIAIAEIIPQYLIMIFTKDPEIIRVGTIGIRIVALAILFTPIPMIVGAKMQAIGKTMWALILYGSNVIFIIAPAILLGKYFGAIGIWWAYVLAYICSNLLVCVKLIIDKYKRKVIIYNSPSLDENGGQL